MKTTITLYNSDNYMSRYVPEDVVGMIEWLTDLLKEVPSEHHDNVTIEFDSDPDTYTVNCIVAYSREETAEEAEAREQKVRDWARQKEERERAEFAKLKAKFEP